MNKALAAIAAAIVVLAFLAGYLYGDYQSSWPALGKESAQKQARGFLAPEEGDAVIFIPAVDEDGKGAAIPLGVRSKNGSGETLIDINSLVFWLDTQKSIQTARDVAQDATGRDLDKASLTYMVNTNATLVEGPSAGAALSIATIAALENKPINKSVMVTGTINPDGTIGQVGGIMEKAAAAKQAGAKLFLVPKGQGTKSGLKPVETCSEQDLRVYCTARYYQTTIDLSETAGIEIKEVATVADARKYFFV